MLNKAERSDAFPWYFIGILSGLRQDFFDMLLGHRCDVVGTLLGHCWDVVVRLLEGCWGVFGTSGYCSVPYPDKNQYIIRI